MLSPSYCLEMRRRSICPPQAAVLLQHAEEEIEGIRRAPQREIAFSVTSIWHALLFQKESRGAQDGTTFERSCHTSSCSLCHNTTSRTSESSRHLRSRMGPAAEISFHEQALVYQQRLVYSWAKYLVKVCLKRSVSLMQFCFIDGGGVGGRVVSCQLGSCFIRHTQDIACGSF